ncbi:MAG TPA: helix-turn-helix transcriptional regulator [Terriglobales bacterium]|jgi:transcriptional regulator with XRE-family HTH domain|nr:helix-turn-helix transcriptional regulator [Terriglobales bacterium]
MPSIGDRIKEIREERKLTQDQLAEKSGVSKGFLSDIENSKRNPSSEYVLKIANALGASLDYLLRGEEPPAGLRNEPVIIPSALAEAAGQLNLSYAETIELLEAHRSVIARRSNRQTKTFDVKDWMDLYKAIKRVFG